MNLDEVINDIIAGKWSEELLEAIRNTKRHELFFGLRERLGSQRKASKYLEEAFNRAGVKYTKCQETGLVITYLLVDEVVYETGRMDSDGDIEDTGEDYGDVAYECPFCGLQHYNIDIALDIISGDRDEYGNPK
jgi:hypothetical protein